MRHFKILAIACLSIFFATSQLSAQSFLDKIIPKKEGISYKEGNFLLNKPFNIVSDPDDATLQAISRRVCARLNEKGASAKISNALSTRNITIEMVSTISGVPSQEPDAYSISVYKDYIDIKYTSTTSLRWVSDALFSLYNEKKGLLSKGITNYIASGKVCKWKGDSAKGAIFDATVANYTVSQLITELSKLVSNNISTIYLYLITADGWKIENRTMHLVNPKEDITKGRGYRSTDLEVILEYARKEGVEIVPVVDFTTSDNALFKQFTGHEVHSVEGLRFTKAFIRELCESCNYERISLGGQIENSVQEKYLSPLVVIVKENGKEPIIVDATR